MTGAAPPLSVAKALFLFLEMSRLKPRPTNHLDEMAMTNCLEKTIVTGVWAGHALHILAVRRRLYHFPRVNQPVEFLLCHESEFQRRLFERQVVLSRVMSDL